MKFTHRVMAVVASAAFVGFAGVASPALAKSGVSTAPGGNKLQCFDGSPEFGGTCTLPSNGAKGSAILALTSDNANGDYAGAYVQNTTLAGQALNKVTQLGYNYSGTKVPTPTELSLNVPIDANGNGTFFTDPVAGTIEPGDFYAFIDAAADGTHCTGVLNASGTMTVNVITDPNCGIYENGVTFRANWAALVAANPDAKVAVDALPFVIAERIPSDDPQTWTVSNVVFGKPGTSK